MLYRRTILISILVVFLSLFMATSQTLAFSFEDDSGLAETNEHTGYTEAGMETRTIPEAIGMFIQILLGFLGVFFLLLSIYAGFRWMLSRGNAQEIEIAKKTLQNAVIGLIVVIFSYAVTFFIMNIFSTVQGT